LIYSYNIWVQCGRPSAGVVHHIKLSCKAKYKLAIRNAYASYENKLSDEMYVHFISKNIPEFWKTWNAKFRKNVNRHVNINGCTSDADVANEFAAHFKNVFCQSAADDVAQNEFLYKRSECLRGDLQSSYDCLDKITVELIGNCLVDMKKGKACGPDDLCAEHLLYAHPALIMVLFLIVLVLVSVFHWLKIKQVILIMWITIVL
jgi:hypothetical protein